MDVWFHATMSTVANIPTSSDAAGLVTTSELAAEYGVSSSAVRQWVDTGRVTPAVVTPGGHYRFNMVAAKEEIDAARRSSNAEAHAAGRPAAADPTALAADGVAS